MRRIAIDVMGGDSGPSVTLPAVMTMLSEQPGLHFVLAGDESAMQPWLQQISASDRSRLQVLHTTDHLGDHVNPASAIRHHRSSSLFLAIDLVRKGEADACVSAGNTGAFIMIGRHLLPVLNGIKRPAMMASLPNTLNAMPSYLLDVGAHINSSADDLVEYARMASILVSGRLNRPARVALLNIGAEAHKGTEVIRAAAQRLEAMPQINYCGYVEPGELFTGRAEVVVCDGFAGNIAIKTSAGVIRTAERLWQQIAGKSWLNGLKATFASSLFQELKASTDPAMFNGASVIGLDGILVKSHGNASSIGFQAAIRQALQELQADVPGLIRAGLA